MFDLSMTSQNVVPPPQYCSRTELYDSVAYDILCNLVILFGLLADLNTMFPAPFGHIKHHKHHKHHGSSSSSSSSSDGCYGGNKALRKQQKHQRKMMRKAQKHGGVVYTTGHYPSVPAAAPHCYPTGVAVPPHGSYPTGSHHPPPVYPGAHGAHGTYPASGPMGGYAAPPMNPAYPSPYPQPGMNPSAPPFMAPGANPYPSQPGQYPNPSAYPNPGPYPNAPPHYPY